MSDVGMALNRAQDKTEQMQARAAAVNELVETGAIDDLTAPAGSDLDQQIAALTAGNQVDSELAKMKAELGQGGGPAGELPTGAPAEAAPAENVSAEEPQP
jgi:phage shock protein A